MNFSDFVFVSRTCVAAAAVALTVALSAAQAQSQSQTSPQAKQSRPTHSGFLGDYSMLKAAPDREGVLLYVNPSARSAHYSKILFRPMEVYVSPSADYKGVQPDVLKRMTDQFQASLQRALTPGYEIVTVPGTDVLEVRFAITGVQPVKPDLSPVDFLPIKAVFNIGRAAAGKSPEVAELTAEMEVLDSKNTRLAAAVANRKGDKTLQQGELITWAHLQAISDYWAQNFRQRLDQMRPSGG
jgi:Protein of unknown function (DUF3313)